MSDLIYTKNNDKGLKTDVLYGIIYINANSYS